MLKVLQRSACSFRCHSDEDIIKLLPVLSGSADEQRVTDFSPKFCRSLAGAAVISGSQESRVLASASGVVYAMSNLQENHQLLEEQEAALAALKVHKELVMTLHQLS